MEVAFDNKLFSKELKEVRKLMGIGLRQAGKLIGINHATLSRLENKSMPDALTLAKCCIFLNRPMEDFILKMKKKNK